MTTARAIFIGCRDARITLRPNPERGTIIVEPSAQLTPELRAAIVRCKPEILAALAGDYCGAALELVLRETQPGTDLRDDLVERFDERLAICLESRIDYGRACRTAYIEIARHIEQTATKSAEGRAA